MTPRDELAGIMSQEIKWDEHWHDSASAWVSEHGVAALCLIERMKIWHDTDGRPLGDFSVSLSRWLGADLARLTGGHG